MSAFDWNIEKLLTFCVFFFDTRALSIRATVCCPAIISVSSCLGTQSHVACSVGIAHFSDRAWYVYQLLSSLHVVILCQVYTILCFGAWLHYTRVYSQ